MVKGGCWDIPAFIVGCYVYYVMVQCFIPTFDVFRVGDFGTFLPELSLHCLVSDEGEICCYCCVFSKMVLSWSFLYSTPAL